MMQPIANLPVTDLEVCDEPVCGMATTGLGWGVDHVPVLPGLAEHSGARCFCEE